MRPLVLQVPLALSLIHMVGCADASARAALDLDAVPALAWREELRIGSVDDPVDGFSQIGGVRVGPGGELYVLDTQAREVRVYDDSGARIRTIGRPGEGPGELERPLSFGLFHDTVWVQDFGTMRISWFDRDGALLFETPTGGRVQVSGDERASVSLRPGTPQPDGTLAQSVGFTVLPGAEVATDSLRIPVVRFGRDGSVLDTVGSTWHRPAASRIVSLNRVAFPVNPGLLSSPREIGDTLSVSWAVEDGEERGALTVVRKGPAGDTVARADFSYPAVPVAPYLDSVVASYGDRFIDRGYPRHMVEEAVRAVLSDVPPHHPPISTYHTSSDGTLWLRRSAAVGVAAPSDLSGGSAAVDPAAAPPDLATWVLIARDGTVRGRLDLPAGMTPSWSDGTTAWMTHRDAVDVPWLVRITIGG